MAAGVGALTLGAAMLLGLGTAAHADPTFGNIDPDAAGSIIIHKHEHQSEEPKVTANPNGTTDIPSAPVGNVTFTVYQLLKDGAAIDLTDPDAWNGLDSLVVDRTCSTVSGGTGYTKGGVVGTGTTDDDGAATVGVGSIGVYIVCETDAPPTVTDEAAPFIVTVPFPHDDGWLYDVNVYPKNAVTTVDKTINAQQGLGLGSVVEFPVTVRVPALETGRDFTSFDISDSLDPRLTPTPAASGVGTGVKSVTVNGVTADPATYTVTATGQVVLVEFDVSLPAVQTLLKNNANNDVVVTFSGAVSSLGDGTDAGVIDNEAVVYINNPADANGDRENPGTPTPQVHTNWGDVKILKTDAATPATALSGAEFQVFSAVTPYPATAAECTNAVATGTALTVGGQSTFTSDDGLVLISGLFVSDSENAPVDKAFRCYVIVETKAPAGFVTPEAPNNAWGVDVTIGKTAIVNGAGHDLVVTNVQQDVPDLPLTGGGGTLAMTIGGLVLVAVGAGAIVLSRRRRASK
jgi:fimbrial isopeptide formation D2 family protein/LPXTG-motif cell wall-anchored protein